PPLTRFRQDAPTNSTYQPREEVALAHPSNFGRRFTQDLFGRPVSNEAIVVLHETVGSGSTTINYFRTSHPRDDDQVSYHTLIRENGNIVYLVPPD
ncbi:MAG: N-acetylmuramoyl-L-alanine amidase, partial [Leptolyngbya sp. ERB_1_2]